ncbi:MAG: mechanosensitive ion channel [Chitinivibrionales bacterium]|nr:mechanosensitive ion channel [Chitinivibrionales bacterium]
MAALTVAIAVAQQRDPDAPPVDVVGPARAVRVFGVKLVGVTLENGRKLLLSLIIIVVLWAFGELLRRVLRLVSRYRRGSRAAFWAGQAISILVTVLMVLGVLSVWFDDPRRLTTAMGLISAGLAFALQRVITAWAGYFVILRGQIFNVGDRITMGGVRGDVIALGFTRTTVMEMGQPPTVKMADPAMWVEARQYTGRIVTITNDKIFDEPIYNYTRDFPYLWEELHIPIPYRADRRRAEAILLNAARKHTVRIRELGQQDLDELRRRYFVRAPDLTPHVYYQITDNWLDLSVRFIVHEHGIRDIKDAMSREIIAAFDAAGIEVASATQEIVGFPRLRVDMPK